MMLLSGTVVAQVHCERPGCKTESGSLRTVSLALWNSPDRALRLCEGCWPQWKVAYDSLSKQLDNPRPNTIIKLTEWSVWLLDMSNQQHNDDWDARNDEQTRRGAA